MVPTIVESKNGRVSRKYALLMDSIGQLRLVQIKDSEVAKYAGWDQTR
jgi:hypothetical protein